MKRAVLSIAAAVALAAAALPISAGAQAPGVRGGATPGGGISAGARSGMSAGGAIAAPRSGGNFAVSPGGTPRSAVSPGGTPRSAVSPGGAPAKASPRADATGRVAATGNITAAITSADRPSPSGSPRRTTTTTPRRMCTRATTTAGRSGCDGASTSASGFATSLTGIDKQTRRAPARRVFCAANRLGLASLDREEILAGGIPDTRQAATGGLFRLILLQPRPIEGPRDRAQRRIGGLRHIQEPERGTTRAGSRP